MVIKNNVKEVKGLSIEMNELQTARLPQPPPLPHLLSLRPHVSSRALHVT